MGLAGRIGMVLLNVAVLIPVYIFLLISAILTSKIVTHLKALEQTEEVKGITTTVGHVRIALWALFIGGLVFSFTFGIVLIPLIVEIPYLYAFVLTLLGVVNAVLAGFLFYNAYKLRKIAGYDSSEEAQSAYKRLLVCGGLMIGASLFMFGYSVVTVYRYRGSGGLTGDAALVGKYGGDLAMAAGQPEIGIPLQALGSAAQKNLDPAEKQELGQRYAQAGKATRLVNTASQERRDSAALKKLLSNPEFVESAVELLA
jgi:hypothetical protein